MNLQGKENKDDTPDNTMQFGEKEDLEKEQRYRKEEHDSLCFLAFLLLMFFFCWFQLLKNKRNSWHSNHHVSPGREGPLYRAGEAKN